jgi:alpha,alpha-trehalose phosphorylase
VTDREPLSVGDSCSLVAQVSPHRRLVPPQEVYPVEPWRVVERRFFPRFLPQYESIFATSNGYLGIRATPEEGFPVHERGTYLNGFYETWPITYGEEAHGFAKRGQTMLCVPDGTLLKLYVDDEPFDLDTARIVSFERALDMQAGALDREVVFETFDRKRVAVRSRRLVSLEHRHLACIRYEVEMLAGRAGVTISSELVAPDHAPGRGKDPRRPGRLDGRPLVPTERRGRDRRVLLNLETASSGLRMACAMDHVIRSEAEVAEEAADTLEDRGRVVLHAVLETGQRLELVKFLAYHHSARADAGELRFRTNRTLDRALDAGFASVEAEQRARVQAFWEASDVVVEDAPEVQQAIRFDLFQILQATARVEGFGVPAKGLTGLGYEGHYFWDTEIYLLPFLVYTRPHVARSLLEHRYTQLDRARLRAREVGQEGALFPWRTINGEEASAYYAASTAQYHINADIVFAASRYTQISGDFDFLSHGFAEIAVETARLWADLGFYSERKGGRFCINGVTGPDEYNTVVNNNAYTNLMARENLRIAIQAATFLRERAPEVHRWLVESTGLEASELDAWREAADRMYVPTDEKTGVHLQDDDFLDREPWDFAETPPANYPLLLHYHPLVIYRHQVIKQADLVLAAFLLGEHFSLEEKRRIFDYYDPLTTGDSSLSVCIQSIVAWEVGYAQRACRYFADAAVMDLGDVGGNVKDGLHVASLGGTWMALVHGFAGLRDHGGRPRFRPALPPGWRRLRFPLRVRGSRFEVDLERERVTYRLLEGEALEIEHEGEALTLEPDRPRSRPLAPRPQAEAPDEPRGFAR